MKRNAHWLILGFFVVTSVIFFWQYIFGGLVPIQFNLLPSFYSPWKYIAWGGYESGVPNKPIGTDNPKLFYPYRQFTTSELKGGSVPLWNPYVFSGNIHAATYQSAVYYPFNILYFLMPQADAWSILVIIQPILVGLFTYLFLKSQKLSDYASLFGAVSFAFSGWMIAWWEESIVIEHSILWLPLALYGSSLLGSQKKILIGFILLVASLSMSILAGFLQMTIYLGITVVLWNLYHRHYLWLILAGFLSLCITAVQWIPALEAYVASPRGVVQATFLFEDFLVPLRHLITFLAPDFWGNPGAYNYFFPKIFYHEKVIYIGIVPLVFALYCLFHARARAITFWKVFSLVTLSLGFALPTSWIWQILKVPILSVANPNRIFVLSSFGFSVLAAYGMEIWWQTRSVRGIRMVLVFLGVAVISLWVFVLGMRYVADNYPQVLLSCLRNGFGSRCSWLESSNISVWSMQYATISMRNLILPTVLLIVSSIVILFLNRRQKILYGILLGLTIFGSLYFAQKFLYFSDRRFEFPLVEPIRKLKELAGLSRVWSYGNAYIEKNIGSFFELYSVEGYDALFSQEYGELLFTIKNEGYVTSQIHRTDVDLKQASENEPMGVNIPRLRLMTLLGVKYILETKLGENKDKLTLTNRFPENLFSLSWEDDTWRIWEYKNALPRAIFISQYEVVTDKTKIVEKLLDPSFDFKTKVLLQQDEALDQSEESVSTSAIVNIISYKPREVVMSVESRAPGFVFLSDTYYPGWVAYVDNKITPIYRANYAFRAVPVADGFHEVKFLYTPKSFQIGLLVSGLGILSCIVFLYASSRQKYI